MTKLNLNLPSYNVNSPAKTVSGSLPSGNPDNVIDPWSLVIETKDK